MEAILYGVGVGPGDPELITLKAFTCIKESDIIILPSQPKEDCHAYRIVRQVYPEIEEKEIVCMPFPMTKDRDVLAGAHQKILERILEYLHRDKSVAFLTIGDPTIYSTYQYIHHQVLTRGIRAVMINGIPSFCAAAARLGLSLGDKEEEIHVIPGSYDISHTLALKGTKVYMKSGKNLAHLKEALSEYENKHNLEVYTVSNCGMIEERIAVGLENLEIQSGYLTLVIVKEKKERD